MTTPHLLSIEDLGVSFTQYRTWLRRHDVPVIRSLSVRVDPGQVVAVVGASGSGKSLLAESILGLFAPNANVTGRITFDGRVLDAAGLRALRGNGVAWVPQSVGALDPLMTVGRQILGVRTDLEAARARRDALLERYGLAPDVLDKYPFELSGGMARRVILACALMEEPRLVVADEPTPGMDADLAGLAMKDLRALADAGSGVLLITHDLDLALGVADRVAVFYAGTVVEDAAAADFTDAGRLRHPYTRALWQSLPRNGFHAWPGTQPVGVDVPDGCPFAPRCPYADAACATDIPAVEMGDGRVRCVHSPVQVAVGVS